MKKMNTFAWQRNILKDWLKLLFLMVLFKQGITKKSSSLKRHKNSRVILSKTSQEILIYPMLSKAEVTKVYALYHIVSISIFILLIKWLFHIWLYLTHVLYINSVTIVYHYNPWWIIIFVSDKNFDNVTLSLRTCNHMQI